MIEILEGIDRWIVLTVNGWHNPFLDEFMWWVAKKSTWIPLYLILLFAGWKYLKRNNFFWYVLLAVVAVALADLASVHLFKNVFLRYRPSHNTWLTENLHFYKLENGKFYKGGQYGFVSSHAANFFALATFTGCILRKYVRFALSGLIFIAVLVSFSRLYQGVHYFSDLLGGALLGASIALLLYHFVYKRWTSIK